MLWLPALGLIVQERASRFFIGHCPHIYLVNQLLNSSEEVIILDISFMGSWLCGYIHVPTVVLQHFMSSDHVAMETTGSTIYNL